MKKKECAKNLTFDTPSSRQLLSREALPSFGGVGGGFFFNFNDL